MTSDTSVYSAMAGVVAITSAAQLALVAALWSISASRVASARAALARTSDEDEQVRTCRRLFPPLLVMAIAGFAVNAGSLGGWWYSLRDVSSIPALVIPFWSVVAVTIGALGIGLVAAFRLLAPKTSDPPPPTLSLD